MKNFLIILSNSISKFFNSLADARAASAAARMRRHDEARAIMTKN